MRAVPASLLPWPCQWVILLAGLAALGQAAININGEHAVEPALASDEDPAPIADITTYHPDQHDCPLPCTDLANTHSWITYHTVQRLNRCPEPMLLQLGAGIAQLVDDPKSNILIRACTLVQGSSSSSNSKRNIGAHVGPVSTSVPASVEELEPVENPKKSEDLILSSLAVAPACVVNGTEANGTTPRVSHDGGDGNGGNSKRIAGLLQGLGAFFATPDNCDENILFAYHNRTVAGVYIGDGLGKPTIASALDVLVKRFDSPSSAAPARTVVQLCGGSGNGRNSRRSAERSFGIAIESAGDRTLASVQRSVLAWSKGTCAVDLKAASEEALVGTRVFEIAGAPAFEPAAGNRTTGGTNSTRPHSLASRMLQFSRNQKSHNKRATCRYIQAVSGDGCASLAERCGITGTDFMKFNTKTDLCSTLQPGDYVCCSAGDPFTEPKPDPPKPGSDGICATHLIKDGDSCDKLAKQFGVTVDDIEKWNKGKTWAWTECKDMLIGYNMCLSDGLAPMPPAQQGTECGPLVPGTERPSGSNASIADLNPCPLKACCSNWGYCGVFPAHCDIHAPPGGGPGTKLKGFTNTCVSNCGNEIKQVSGPPAAGFGRVGYYSAFNMNRKCLWLKAKNANTDGTYTHIHWAFGDIDPNGWKPAIKDGKGEWEDFKKLEGVKKILSLGGWAYSTEPATYNIIRQAILQNRDQFATNLAQFAKDEGLDGIDIDWEYPGVST